MSDLPKKMTEALDNYYNLYNILVAGMYRGVIAELGEEKGAKVMRRAFHESGKIFGEMSDFTKQSGPPDAKAFAEAHAAGTNYYGYQSELVSGATSKKAIVRFHRCPILETLKPLGINVCDVYAQEADAGCAEFVNPKLKLTVTKSLARGDPYCEYVFEVKD